MCKVKGVTVGIKDLNFTAHRGKMSVRLTDGHLVTESTTCSHDSRITPLVQIMLRIKESSLDSLFR